MDLEILQDQKSGFLCGIDEVGRGPLAGPVVCCSVAIEYDCFTSELKELLNEFNEKGITDSKKLSENKRKKILTSIGVELTSLESEKKYILLKGQNFKVSFFISEISHLLVDEMNILAASLYGMEESFFNLNLEGEGKILIDGNKVPSRLVMKNSQALVKGDSKSLVIGLASIIAKEYRDELMKKLGELYPGYGLENHAGYPTKSHKEALIQLGVTPIHRKTFKGVKELII